MIPDFLNNFIDTDNVLLLLGNQSRLGKTSSDIDLYCITTKAPSAVHLFHNEAGVWTELFIDTLDDVYKKINNVDEIAINFIRELEFISGDRQLYTKLLEKTHPIVSRYLLPRHRKNLLKYRAKVLFSKYLYNNSNIAEVQKNFILNALSYPLVQLIMEYHGIFPSSPKRWLEQLKDCLSEADFALVRRFLSHESDHSEICLLYEKYAGNLTEIHIEKDGENNLTFLS